MKCCSTERSNACLSSGDVYASQFLIENGASVNTALPENQLTPLHLAVLQSHDPPSTNHMSSIIELLLQKAADADARDSNCRSESDHVMISDSSAGTD